MSSFSKAAIDTISKYKGIGQGIPFVAKQALQLRIITGLSLGIKLLLCLVEPLRGRDVFQGFLDAQP